MLLGIQWMFNAASVSKWCKNTWIYKKLTLGIQ